MIRIVSVKFRPAGKHYDFNAQDFELNTDDRVVVETNRGRALGTVVRPPIEKSQSEAPEDMKNVLRIATEEDIAMSNNTSAQEENAYRFCLQRIQERKMEMKLVRAEYLFDGSKIIFYFTADGRVDFRELVKDLAHHFHTRIEMRQIGVRDEAKLIGGLGICGRELCCCTFLTDFAPVSVKMAKEQGLALNPNKISGQCGRLLCCLNYEFETYCALKKELPKCGCKIQLEGRSGEIVNQSILNQKVTARMEDGQQVELTPEQIETGKLPQKKAVEPVSEISDKKPKEQKQPKPKPATTPEGKSKPQKRQGPESKDDQSKPSASRPARRGGKKRGRSRNRPRRK